LKNARFASRGELCSTLGEVEKRRDGVFQQAASAWRLMRGRAAEPPSASFDANSEGRIVKQRRSGACAD
jgi:hypothetical protein